MAYASPGTKKSGQTVLVDARVFNNVLTTLESASVDALGYKKFSLMVDKAVGGAPTTIEVRVQVSPDNVNWYHHTNGPFGSLLWEDTAGTEAHEQAGDIVARYIRVYLVAVGTTAVNRFTVTVRLQLMN